ncbi:MAG: 16S rRNA processing protein RimM [Nitrospirae bacterium]|nr:16S rRNA processing protein RimM [Nitrospirota bacterium]
MTERVADNLVCIGVGVRAHGVRGELRVTSLSELPDRFSKGLRVVWRRDGHPDRVLTVQSAHPQGDKVILRFSGIADRTAAEGLNGGGLWAAADSSPRLDEGAYYHHQLIGLAVQDEAGAPLGTLTAILETGAHDNYEVTTAAGARFMVPAVSVFVRRVDLDGGRMVIRPIPGLLPEAGGEG